MIPVFGTNGAKEGDPGRFIIEEGKEDALEET